MTAPNPKPLNGDSLVVASRDQVSSELGSETVLLSLTSAQYYGLGGVGTRIWELVREPVRVSTLCERLAEEYDVAPAQCEADVLRFLGELADRGLLEVRGAA